MAVDCSRAVPVERTSGTGGGRYRMLALGVGFNSATGWIAPAIDDRLRNGWTSQIDLGRRHMILAPVDEKPSIVQVFFRMSSIFSIFTPWSLSW